MNSVALVCAHRWEADPFLKIGKMEAYQAPHLPFPVFRNPEGAYLVLTGQGYLKTAAAVAAFLSHHLPHISAIGNFGVAGAPPGGWPVGQAVLLNKVVDITTGKSYFPERQLPSPWPETFAECRPTPMTVVLDEAHTSLLPHPVYDMESAALFGASEQYITTSLLLLGKVVSDHLADADPTEIRRKLVEPYTEACHIFWELLERKGRLMDRDPRRGAARHAGTITEELIEELKSRLPLTVNQERDLKSRLLGRMLVAPSPGSLKRIRDTFASNASQPQEPWTKPEIKRRLEKILEELEKTL